MLEIILLVALCTYTGKVLRAKGHKPLGYQVGLVLAYYVGCFAGGFLCGMLAAVNGTSESDLFFMAMIFALGGGLLSSGFVVMLAKMAPDLSASPTKFGNQYTNNPRPIVQPPISDNPYAPSMVTPE